MGRAFSEIIDVLKQLKLQYFINQINNNNQILVLYTFTYTLMVMRTDGA